MSTLAVTDNSFEADVLKASGPVLVDFWATWCGPCLAIAPVIEQLAKEFEGKAIVGKIDVDNNPQVATAFGIRSIPTLLVFKNGELVDKHVGVASAEQLRTKLEANM